MANFASVQLIDDRFGRPDLPRACEIAEARCQIDRIAIAITVDFHDLAARDADLKLHAQRGRPGLQPLLMVALHFEHGPRGGNAVSEHGKHAVAERFHDATAMGLAYATDPLGQPRHGLGGARIPHGLEDPGAPRQVSKYDSGIGAHVVQFLVALASGLWQRSTKRLPSKGKSLDLSANLLLFHFDTLRSKYYISKSNTLVLILD